VTWLYSDAAKPAEPSTNAIAQLLAGEREATVVFQVLPYHRKHDSTDAEN
jgi:hypothetical protein